MGVAGCVCYRIPGAYAVASPKTGSADLKEPFLCRVAAQCSRLRQPTEFVEPQIKVSVGKGKENVASEPLKGWREIASFLGQPASVAQRWAGEGMPVRRQGRFVTSTPEELNRWLGQESGKPVHVVTDESDLTAELKRGISFLRHSPQKEAERTARVARKKKTT